MPLTPDVGEWNWHTGAPGSCRPCSRIAHAMAFFRGGSVSWWWRPDASWLLASVVAGDDPSHMLDQDRHGWNWIRSKCARMRSAGEQIRALLPRPVAPPPGRGIIPTSCCLSLTGGGGGTVVALAIWHGKPVIVLRPSGGSEADMLCCCLR